MTRRKILAGLFFIYSVALIVTVLGVTATSPTPDASEGVAIVDAPDAETDS